MSDVPWLPNGRGDPAERLPQRRLGGFDVEATLELLKSAETAYLELASERDALAEELQKTRALNESVVAERGELLSAHEAQQASMVDEVGNLKREIERLTSSEATLRSLWENAEKEMEQARIALDRLHEEAAQFSSELEAQREREQGLVELQNQVERNLEQFGELEQAHTELKAERDADAKASSEREAHLVAELDAERANVRELTERLEEERERSQIHERELASKRKREDVVAQMIESSKARAESIRAEARAEAALTLKKAREREQLIVGNAHAQLKQIEAEQVRIEAKANELRESLSSVLLATLKELKPQLRTRPEGEIKVAPRRRPARRSQAAEPRQDENAATTKPSVASVKRTRSGSS